MDPRVLVDATAVPADRGGVGRYVDGLIAALGELDANLAVVCQRSDAERYGRLAPEATVVPGPPAISHRPARLAWEQTGLALVAQQVNADVVHSPHYTMPLRVGRPVVVTIHDATFFTEPDMHTAVKGTFFRSATRTALRRAARCIVPEQGDPRRGHPGPGRRSHQARRGVSRRRRERFPPADRRREGAGTPAPRPGSVSNTSRSSARSSRARTCPNLIRGWSEAVHWRDEPPALVLAGGSGWDHEVDAAIAEVPPNLRVLRPGYLRFQDLPGYLGGAELVAYPSHGEGFGLPVLEAMACGVPVLTTPRLSLPEVGGDAVAYTEPEASAIATNLAELLSDAPRRADLGRRGLARAHEFTWAASAEAHLASYARAFGE